MAALGCEREREQRRGEGTGENERAWGARGDAREGQGKAASRRWPSVAVRVLARRGHTASSFWRKEEDDWQR